MPSKQTRHSGARKRGHGNSERDKDKDKDRERQNDREGRGTSRKVQHEKGQPKRVPSISPKPRKPPPKPRPDSPTPEPEPEPEPKPEQEQDPEPGPEPELETESEPEPWPNRETEIEQGGCVVPEDVSHTSYVSSAPSGDIDKPSFLQSSEPEGSDEIPESTQIEIASCTATAVFDWDIRESFVSESFAESLPVKAKRTSKDHVIQYYNTPPATRRIKAPLYFRDIGSSLSKDVTFYIVPGIMPYKLEVVLGSKMASQYMSMLPLGGRSMAGQSPYQSSQGQSPHLFSSSPLAFRPGIGNIPPEPYQYQPTPSSYTSQSQYTFSPQQSQSEDFETPEYRYQSYQPASLDHREFSHSQPEQSSDLAYCPAGTTGAPLQEHEGAVGDTNAGTQSLNYGHG